MGFLMTSEETSGVTRTDCIRQLEHLATEYIDARRLPAILAFAELTRLDAVATDLLASAWDSGYLICVDDIASKLGHKNIDGWGHWIFSGLVGYNSFERVPVWEPAYLLDQLDLVRKIEVEHYRYYLAPGWLQPETGFMEFQRIDLGVHVDDVESRFEAKLNNCFEIMGYRSKACKILIEMFEQEIRDESEQAFAPEDESPQTAVLINGLDRETRSFRWGVDLFVNLSDEVMDAMKLIEDDHKRGRVTTKARLLKGTSQESIGKLFRSGDAKCLGEMLVHVGGSVTLPDLNCP